MAAFAIPLITAGLSAVSGLFGAKPKKTITDSTQDSSTNPNFSPLQNSLMQMFTSGAMSRYQKGTDLGGYTAGGLRTINNHAGVQDLATRNILASRGLSYSPAAATSQIQNENSRLGQSSDFLNSIPLLQRQLQGQDLDSLIKAFASIPTGTTSHGTAHSESTTPTPGGGIGGFIGGLGQGLLAPNTNDNGDIVSNLSRMFGGRAKGPGVSGLDPNTWSSIFGSPYGG